MSWNYRVIRFDEECGPVYEIYECYYSRKGETIPTRWTEEPAHLISETRNGLLFSLSMMAEAVSHPVLEIHEGRLREVEPKREFGDELKRILEQAKTIGTGDHE